jgi:hypothetical protein
MRPGATDSGMSEHSRQKVVCINMRATYAVLTWNLTGKR